MSKISIEVAISRAIQSWLLDNEPTPIAKRLAIGLSQIDTSTRLDMTSLLLRRNASLSVEAVLLYNLVQMLGLHVHQAIEEMAKETHDA